ncbi:MAG: hypothetical protein HY226_02875 [Candidatus Vogelbacteria bacterium]|nr:hypothetical protein [Candidatus Vogelbacteria bacterium]
MFKKIVISSLIVSSLAIGFIAFANTDTTTPTTTNTPTVATVPSIPAQPMVLQIEPKGNALLRGTIDSIASSSLVGKSWGGNWTVNFSSSTKLMPNDIAQFKAGDFIGVQGIVNQASPWTIDATIIRNKVPGPKNSQDNQEDRGQNKPKENENSQGDRGQKGPRGPMGQNQGVQQQIQFILEQIKKIQAQINAQQGQPTQ